MNVRDIAKRKVLDVIVKQKHIDDAYRLCVLRIDQSQKCPLALAIKDKFGGYDKNGDCRNLSTLDTISVADDITIIWYSRTGYLEPPSCVTLNHSTNSARFVFLFDKAKPILPRKFRLRIAR